MWKVHICTQVVQLQRAQISTDQLSAILATIVQSGDAGNPPALKMKIKITFCVKVLVANIPP